MNVQDRKRRRRHGQALGRTVLALGTVTAGALAYLLSGVNQVEAIMLPVIVLGLVCFGVALRGRAKKKIEWSAAWDAYTAHEVPHAMTKALADHEIFSRSATN